MLNFVIELKDTSVTDSQIWVSIIGTDPSSSSPAYVNLSTGTLVPVAASSWSYKSGTYSSVLSALKDSASDTYKIAVPSIKSARIYFFFYKDGVNVPVSGPDPTKTGTDFHDKIEFDTSASGWCNMNPTSVDFYGVSFTVTAIPKNESVARTIGMTADRATVIKAMQAIPDSSGDPQNGDTGIFKKLIASTSDNVLRVISPKTAAQGDWGSSDVIARFSHYLDAYVTKCFPEGREFQFYDKWYPQQTNLRYAKVSGGKILLYTDSARTVPYKVSELVIPKTSSFDKPAVWIGNGNKFHYTAGDDADQVDWGFMLMGNVNGSGVCANWGIDPAGMAIMMALCRGVAHMDNTAAKDKWTDSSNYYKGSGSGASTSSMPIVYYASVLHAHGIDNECYAFSYDDVYGKESSMYFNDGETVTISLNSVGKVAP